MQVVFNFSKLQLSVFVFTAFILFAGVFVIAYNSSPSNPPSFGHSTNEIDWSPSTVPMSSLNLNQTIQNGTFLKFGYSGGLLFNGLINAWKVNLVDETMGPWVPEGQRSMLVFTPVKGTQGVVFTNHGNVIAHDFCTDSLGNNCLSNVGSSIPTPPNCAAGQVLTYSSGAWSCVANTQGITAEKAACYGMSGATYEDLLPNTDGSDRLQCDYIAERACEWVPNCHVEATYFWVQWSDEYDGCKWKCAPN
jgi:hypothetical protein